MAVIHKKVFTSQKGLRSTGGPDLLKWGLPGGGVKSAKVAPIPYVYFPPEVHVWSYTGVDLPRYRVGFFIKKKQKGPTNRKLGGAAMASRPVLVSPAGTRTRVFRVRAEYPDRLDYRGFRCYVCGKLPIQRRGSAISASEPSCDGCASRRQTPKCEPRANCGM